METRHTDTDLAQRKKKRPVQLIRLEYTAKDTPPLELDHGGTTYVFPALGRRYEQKKMPKTQKINGLEVDAQGQTIKSTVRFMALSWCEVKGAQPLLDGENAVEVPVEAWRAWQNRQSERKKFTNEKGELQLIATATKLEAMALDFTSLRAEKAKLQAEIAELEAVKQAMKPKSASS